MHVTERWFSSPKCGPYGGGPDDEDIFVTFGLTPREYFTGLTTLLPLLPAGELTPSQLRTIRTLCAERLGYRQDDDRDGHHPPTPARAANG